MQVTPCVCGSEGLQSSLRSPSLCALSPLLTRRPLGIFLAFRELQLLGLSLHSLCGGETESRNGEVILKVTWESGRGSRLVSQGARTGTERSQDDDSGDLKSDLRCASSWPGDLGGWGLHHLLGLGFSVCETEGVSCMLSEVPFTVALRGPWLPPHPNTHTTTRGTGYDVEEEGAPWLAAAGPEPHLAARAQEGDG